MRKSSLKIKIITENKGMTLVEILAAMAIMLLVTSGLVTCITIATKQYQLSMQDSEAKILFTTLYNYITNELSYADYIDDSSVDGVDFYFSNSNKSKAIYGYLVEDGKIKYKFMGEDKKYDMLNPVLYTNGLKVTSFILTYDERNYCFEVQIGIGTKDEELFCEQFSVINYNRIKFEE